MGWALGILLAEVTTPVVTQAQDKNWIGYVSQVSGTWRSEHDVVELGWTIAEADTLRAEHGSHDKPRITIVLNDGRRVSFACDSPATCSRPFVPADSVRHESRLGRFTQVVQAAASVMHKDPRRWVSLASRGDGALLRDGVLRIVGTQVDLRPLLENEQPGSYQVDLESECDGQGGRTVQAMVERSEDGTAWLEAPGLKRGPYTAVVSSLSSLSETRWVAWVLLVPENHYAEQESQFDLAREIVDAWGEEVAEGEREAFIRAYILHLGDAECESSS